MNDSPDEENRVKKYDKIKHLVEVDYDILAVFSVNSISSPELKELYIAKNANIDRNYIDSLFNILRLNQEIEKDNQKVSAIGQEKEANNLLGKTKWIVVEYERIRILKILEEDRIIYILINSNTQLEHTVDNILGYYYDLDEIPKSLF